MECIKNCASACSSGLEKHDNIPTLMGCETRLVREDRERYRVKPVSEKHLLPVQNVPIFRNIDFFACILLTKSPGIC
jgi:hypothetical protein